MRFLGSFQGLLRIWLYCSCVVDSSALPFYTSGVAYIDYPLFRREILAPKIPYSRDNQPLTTRAIEYMTHPGFQHFLDIGNDWNMYYSSWNSVALPVQPAAWALTALYAHFQIMAKSTWRKTPPQSVVSGKFGALQLIMICPEKPIPWDFVEKFATQMLTLTASGWTGTFQVMLSQATSDTSIGVELAIIGK